MALIGFIKSAINLLATALGDSEINSPLDQNHPINHNDLRSEIKLQDGLKAVRIRLHQFPLALSATNTISFLWQIEHHCDIQKTSFPIYTGNERCDKTKMLPL